jgi:hypothetical protein
MEATRHSSGGRAYSTRHVSVALVFLIEQGCNTCDVRRALCGLMDELLA